MATTSHNASRTAHLLALMNGADLASLAGLVAAGALDPHITWRASRKQLPDAITLLQTRTISGKAVLRVD